MPIDAREQTGWMFSRDHAHAISGNGQHLGLGGSATRPGCLVMQSGLGEPIVGDTPLQRWTWNRVLLVCEARACASLSEWKSRAGNGRQGRAPFRPVNRYLFRGGAQRRGLKLGRPNRRSCSLRPRGDAA